MNERGFCWKISEGGKIRNGRVVLEPRVSSLIRGGRSTAQFPMYKGFCFYEDSACKLKERRISCVNNNFIHQKFGRRGHSHYIHTRSITLVPECGSGSCRGRDAKERNLFVVKARHINPVSSAKYLFRHKYKYLLCLFSFTPYHGLHPDTITPHCPTNRRSGRYKYAGGAGLSLCSASSHQPLSSQKKLTAALLVLNRNHFIARAARPLRGGGVTINTPM